MTHQCRCHRTCAPPRHWRCVGLQLRRGSVVRRSSSTGCGRASPARAGAGGTGACKEALTQERGTPDKGRGNLRAEALAAQIVRRPPSCSCVGGAAGWGSMRGDGAHVRRRWRGAAAVRRWWRAAATLPSVSAQARCPDLASCGSSCGGASRQDLAARRLVCLRRHTPWMDSGCVCTVWLDYARYAA